MAFDPDEYLKNNPAPSFDPDAYLAKNAAPAEPQTSSGQAALEHFGNAATLGYLPHIQAATESLMPDPNADVDEKLRGAGFKIDQPEQSYLASRDANLKRVELEGKEHPMASALGTGAGIAATAAVPVGAAAKGATLGAKGWQGAKAGAVLGALANPGDKEGEIDPLQVGDRLKAAAFGGAVGAAAPVALQGASKAFQKGSEFLRRKAGRLAEKATGATGKGAEQFAEGTGTELLDRGVVKFGSSPRGIAENAQGAIDRAQTLKTDILENQLKGTNVDRNRVYNFIRNKIKSLRDNESQVDLVKKLESGLDDVVEVSERTSNEIPLTKSEEIRRGFDKRAKWDSNSDAPSKEAAEIFANAYREAGEQAATAADPALGAAFKREKTIQHIMRPVRDAAEKRALQLQQSPPVGLLDITAAGSGGTIGALLGDSKESAAVGGLSGLALKALRPRYASMGAVGANQLSRGAAAAARGASQLNPVVVQHILQRLGRGSPELAPQDNPILKNPEIMERFRKDPALIEHIQDEKTKNLVRRALGKRGVASE